MFERMVIERVRSAAARYPAVTILGARQVGKTTLARRAFSAHAYVDLEDPRSAGRFRDNPRYELDAAPATGLVLDEAQAVPYLFPALRGAIEANRPAMERFQALGEGEDLRLESETVAGGALLDSERVVHVAAFKADAPTPRARRTGHRRPARAGRSKSRRRREFQAAHTRRGAAR